MLSPIGSPATVSVPNPQVTFQITGGISQSDFTIKLNNQVVSGVYNASNHTFIFTPNLIPGANSIDLRVANANGVGGKTLNIIYAPPGGKIHH